MSRIPANLSGISGINPGIVVPNIGVSAQDSINIDLAQQVAGSNFMAARATAGSNERIASMELASSRWEIQIADNAARDARADSLSYANYAGNLNYAQNNRVLNEKEYQFDKNFDASVAEWRELSAKDTKASARDYQLQLLGQLAVIDASERQTEDQQANRNLQLQMFKTAHDSHERRKNEIQAVMQLSAGLGSLISIGSPLDIYKAVNANPLFRGFIDGDDMVAKIESGELSETQLKVAGQVSRQGVKQISSRLREEFGAERTGHLIDGWRALVRSGKFSVDQFGSYTGMTSAERNLVDSTLVDTLPAFTQAGVTPKNKTQFVVDLINWGPGLDSLTVLSGIASSVWIRPIDHEAPQVKARVNAVRRDDNGSSIEIVNSRIVTEATDENGTINISIAKQIIMDELSALAAEGAILSDDPMASAYNPRR